MLGQSHSIKGSGICLSVERVSAVVEQEVVSVQWLQSCSFRRLGLCPDKCILMVGTESQPTAFAASGASRPALSACYQANCRFRASVLS